MHRPNMTVRPLRMRAGSIRMRFRPPDLALVKRIREFLVKVDISVHITFVYTYFLVLFCHANKSFLLLSVPDFRGERPSQPFRDGF